MNDQTTAATAIARATVMDDLAGLIRYALVNGVTPEDLTADFEAQLGNQDELAADEYGADQRAALAEATRTAVGLVLELDEADANQVITVHQADEETVRWYLPGTFGSDQGTARWQDVAEADGQFIRLRVDASDDPDRAAGSYEEHIVKVAW